MKARFAHMKKRAEDGVVLVWYVLCLSILLLMVGFAVDLGNWYLQAEKLQRAADAAALAGVANMPDEAKAIATATETLAKNQYVQTSAVTFTITPKAPNKLRVEVKDDYVKSYFISSALDHISIKRWANAEFRKPLPMGSPFNVIGTGNLSMTGAIATEKMNYWGAVNGWCAAKEDVDLYLSRFDANYGGGTANCPFTVYNKDYRPLGYDYAVKIPASANLGTVTIRAYDAGYAQGRTGPLGKSPDAFLGDLTKTDRTTQLTTYFTVFDTKETHNKDDDVVVASKTFDSASLPTCSVGNWCDLYSVVTTSQEKTYRVHVHTKEGELMSWGANAYSLWVKSSKLTNDTCDKRTLARCPQVHALDALSVYTNIATTTSISFYLADIDKSFAGRSLSVSLWDPGEGAYSVQLHAPNNTARTFKWSAVPNYADGSLNGVTDTLIVNGTGPQPYPTTRGTNKFNDRLVNMTTVVPVDYPNYIPPSGSTWWKVNYKVLSGSVPTDRTTWLARVDDTTAVHLTRGEP